ncbi:hypothetical protein Tco_1286752, partial [Tanacetum coccineum]
YGYIKNHKKTVKNGQARTRESEEYKKKPKNQSRSQKSQALVKSILSRHSLAQDQAQVHVSNGKSTQGDCGILTLNSPLKGSTSCSSGMKITAILECIQFDQTATIEAPMIKRFDGQD